MAKFKSKDYRDAVRQVLRAGYSVDQIVAARPNWNRGAIEAEARAIGIKVAPLEKVDPGWTGKLAQSDNVGFAGNPLMTEKSIAKKLTPAPKSKPRKLRRWTEDTAAAKTTPTPMTDKATASPEALKITRESAGTIATRAAGLELGDVSTPLPEQTSAYEHIYNGLHKLVSIGGELATDMARGGAGMIQQAGLRMPFTNEEILPASEFNMFPSEDPITGEAQISNRQRGVENILQIGSLAIPGASQLGMGLFGGQIASDLLPDPKTGKTNADQLVQGFTDKYVNLYKAVRDKDKDAVGKAIADAPWMAMDVLMAAHGVGKLRQVGKMVGNAKAAGYGEMIGNVGRSIKAGEFRQASAQVADLFKNADLLTDEGRAKAEEAIEDNIRKYPRVWVDELTPKPDQDVQSIKVKATPEQIRNSAILDLVKEGYIKPEIAQQFMTPVDAPVPPRFTTEEIRNDPSVVQNAASAQLPASDVVQNPESVIGNQKSVSTDALPVDAQTLHSTIPNAKWTDLADGHRADLPNGQWIEFRWQDSIQPDMDQARQQFGPDVKPEDITTSGRWTLNTSRGQVDPAGIVWLAKDAVESSTPSHEIFHAATDLVLDAKEIEALKRSYGDMESAAEAYAQWQPAQPNTIFGKVYNWAKGIVDKVFKPSQARADRAFRDINSGSVWERHAGELPAEVRPAAEMKQSGDVTQNAGPFGPIYRDLAGKPAEAIDHLIQMKDGEVPAALHRDDIGDIDLVWGIGGDKGYGLAHIIDKHGIDIARRIPDILEKGIIDESHRRFGRIYLDTGDHRLAVRLDWDGQEKVWVVTAFEKHSSSHAERTPYVPGNEGGETTPSPRDEPITDYTTKSADVKPVPESEIKQDFPPTAKGEPAEIAPGDLVIPKDRPDIELNVSQVKPDGKVELQIPNDGAIVTTVESVHKNGTVIPADEMRAAEAETLAVVNKEVHGDRARILSEHTSSKGTDRGLRLVRTYKVKGKTVIRPVQDNVRVHDIDEISRDLGMSSDDFRQMAGDIIKRNAPEFRVEGPNGSREAGELYDEITNYELRIVRDAEKGQAAPTPKTVKKLSVNKPGPDVAEAQARYDRARAEVKRQQRRVDEDPNDLARKAALQEVNKAAKAAGMRLAAAKRQASGDLTPKEKTAEEKRQKSNYFGKRVVVTLPDGSEMSGTATGSIVFGKPKIKLDSGEFKTFSKESIRPEEPGQSQMKLKPQAEERLRVEGSLPEPTRKVKKLKSARKKERERTLNALEGLTPKMPERSGTVTVGPNGEVVKLSDIPKQLSEVLAPIRVGRFNKYTVEGVKILGIAKQKSKVIRIAKANDIATIAHEVGHILQPILWEPTEFENKYDVNISKSIPEEFRNELKFLQGQGHATEGFGNFVAEWMMDPAQAKADAPNVFEHFESTLSKNKEIWSALKEAQETVAKWQELDPKAQVDSTIDFDGKDPQRAYTVARMYADFVDSQDPIRRAEKDINKDQDVPIGESAYKQAWLARGSGGIADTWIRHGITDQAGNTVGVGLNDRLKPVASELREWQTYALSKHALDVIRIKGEDAMPLPESKYRTVIASVPPEKQKVYDRVLRDVVEFQNKTLEMLVESGMVDPELLQEMREKWPSHLPLYPKTDKPMGQGSGRKKFANLPDPIKKLVGGGEDIIPPLESIVKDTFDRINMAVRNKAMVKMIDLAGKNGDAGWLVERVNDPLQPVKFTMEDILSPWEVKKIERIGMDPTKVFTIWDKKGKPPADESIVRVFRNGEAEYYQLDPELYATVMGQDAITANRIEQAHAWLTGMLRVGATSTLAFPVRNFSRDLITSMVTSRSSKGLFGLSPVDLVKAAHEVVTKGDIYWQWKGSGGAQSSLASVDRKFVTEALRGLDDASYIDKLIDGMRHPIEQFRKVGEFSEETFRIAEFGKGIDWGKDGVNLDRVMEAAINSRDLTIDFSRSGNAGKWLNRHIPFFNAAIGGTDRIVRAFKEAPGKTTARALMYVTAPTLALYAMNRNNDDYWELPQYERDVFWHIPLPPGINGNGKSIMGRFLLSSNGKFIKVAKPFELGVIFGTIPERILASVDKHNPHAFDKLFPSWDHLGDNLLAETFTPTIIPTVAIPLIQNATNTSFAGTPIDPRSEEGWSADEHYDSRTSAIGKIVGKAVHASPRKVDNTITGYTGSLGKYGLKASTALLEETGIVDQAPRASLDWRSQLLQAFGVGGSEYSSSSQLGYMYEERNKLMEAKDKAKRRTGPELSDDQLHQLITLDTRLNAVSGARKLRKGVEDCWNDEQLEAIAEKYNVPLEGDNIHDRKRAALMFLHERTRDILNAPLMPSGKHFEDWELERLRKLQGRTDIVLDVRERPRKLRRAR